MANKQDKTNALDESEIVQLLEIEELVNLTQTPCRVVNIKIILWTLGMQKLKFFYYFFKLGNMCSNKGN